MCGVSPYNFDLFTVFFLMSLYVNFTFFLFNNFTFSKVLPSGASRRLVRFSVNPYIRIVLTLEKQDIPVTISEAFDLLEENILN